MKNQRSLTLGLTMVILSTAVRAAEPEMTQTETNRLNRVSVQARIGFNITAGFKNLGRLRLQPDTRTTPNGDARNYDDGYVLRDISDNFGGETWYWGYDNASQVSGDTILMNRHQPLNRGSSPLGVEEGDPQWGGEIVYNREFGRGEKVSWGAELAANYMNIGFEDRSGFRSAVRRTTDAYPFHPGTTPPLASYAGTFDGPGFVLGDTPVSSTTQTLPQGASVTGCRELDADVWGFRLGPYLDIPMGTNWNLSLSAGLAVGLIAAHASWNESVQINGRTFATSRGDGDEFDGVLGGYASARISYRISERWSLEAGAQFQALNGFDEDVGGRRVEIDLGQSVFVTAGVSYTF